MTNRLSESASPYLRQHADNPVHWMEWGDEAFAEARRRECPIFLSIGYAACHWCHVMAHESFEDVEVAARLNRDFVSVKVDREERPDVDQIYMAALHALGEQGGWPLSMFMDADGRPFWGGTYFPPTARYGRPSFTEVLGAVRKTWDEDRKRIEHNASGLSDHLHKALAPPLEHADVSREALDTFADRLLELVDFERGGLTGAPKFPNAPITEAHFRAWKRTGDARHRRAFQSTLEGMAQGGIFDHVGGGLSRYSTDADWLVPHFEKMLYDNASFLMQTSWLGSELAEDRILSTITWLEREMATGQGYAASLDADTEGDEGATYTWTPEEIRTALVEEADGFVEAFNINGPPNFEGRWIPHRVHNAPPLSLALKQQADRLLTQRSERPQPDRDDKALTDWNMSMVQALVACGATAPTAIDLARTLFNKLPADPASLVHSRLGDRSVGPALLSDHVETALAALALFSLDCDPARVEIATAHLAEIEKHYLVDGLPVLTHDAADDLLVRPSAFTDDPNPSPASRLSILLTTLGALGVAIDLDLKGQLEGALAAHLQSSRYGTAGAANALDHALRVSTLVLHEAPDRWLEALGENPDPARFAIRSGPTQKLPDWHPASLLCRGDEPVAILCRGQTCLPPARDLNDLKDLLA